MRLYTERTVAGAALQKSDMHCPRAVDVLHVFIFINVYPVNEYMLYCHFNMNLIFLTCLFLLHLPPATIISDHNEIIRKLSLMLEKMNASAM